MSSRRVFTDNWISDFVEVFMRRGEPGVGPAFLSDQVPAQATALGQQMQRRCMKVSRFFETSDEGDYTRCVIEPEDHGKRCEQGFLDSSKGLRNASDLVQAHYREIKDYDPKRFDCSSQLQKPSLLERSGIACGTTDFCLLLSVHHNYWAAHMRRSLAQCSEVQGLAFASCHRIKGSSATDLNWEKAALVAYTFVEFPSDVAGFAKTENGSGIAVKTSRREYLQQLVDGVLGTVDEKRWFTSEKLDCDIDMYLTFSTAFPVMICSRHYSAASLVRFHKALSRRRGRAREGIAKIRDWCTVLAFRPPSIPQGHSNRGIVSADDAESSDVPPSQKELLDNSEERLRFLVLVRVKRSASRKNVEDAKNQLRKMCIEFDERPFDLRARMELSLWHYGFECVPRSLGLFISKLAEINEEGGEWLDRTAAIPWITLDHDSFPAGTPDDARVWEPERFASLEGLLARDESAIPNVKMGDMPACWDSLNEALYNMQFDWEWIGSYLLMLGKSWRVWARVGDDQTGKPAGYRTLDRLAQQVEQRLQGARRIVNTYVKKMSRFKQELMLEPLSEDWAPLLNTYWNYAAKDRAALAEIKEILAKILSALRDSGEAASLVNTNDALRHMTEQGGVSELGTESARRLFRDYLGAPRESSVLQSELEVRAQAAEEEITWDGIVTSSSEEEFWVWPEYQLLSLPVDFKFRSKSKLPLLAHEAAHCCLELIAASEQSRRVLSEKLVDVIKNEGISLVSRALKRDDTKEMVVWRFQRDFPVGEAIGRNELLADLFAAIFAGPSYFRGLMPLVVRVCDDETFPLSGFVRAKLGVLVGRELGWCVPGPSGYRRDPWFVFERAEMALRTHYAEDLLQESDLSSMTPLEIRQRPWIGSPYYWALRVLESNPALLLSAWEFIEAMGRDMAFYPYVDSPGLRMEAIEAINVLCSRTMCRLMYKDEVVMDRAARTIAGATAMPPHGRPYHSESHVLHSIYYTEAMFGDDVRQALQAGRDGLAREVESARELVWARFRGEEITATT